MALDPHFLEIRPLELGNYAGVGSQTFEEALAACISWPLTEWGEEPASSFQQPAEYMSLIFCSSGRHTVTSLPDVKGCIKIERRKGAGLQLLICLISTLILVLLILSLLSWKSKILNLQMMIKTFNPTICAHANSGKMLGYRCLPGVLQKFPFTPLTQILRVCLGTNWYVCALLAFSY